MTVEVHRPEHVAAVDSWVFILQDVANLSTQIAGTELVPDSIRTNPAAIAATILYGREVGLPPMTALRTVYVVRGRVALLAEAMRALALAAGHVIEYRESTTARCIVAGRRRDSDTWHVVEWNGDNVRQAGLQVSDGWKKYPRAMLKARATSELCRDLFPDTLGGFDALEEVDVVDEATGEVTSQPKRRTLRRGRVVERNLPELPSEQTTSEPVSEPRAEPKTVRPKAEPESVGRTSEQTQTPADTGSAPDAVPPLPGEVSPPVPEPVEAAARSQGYSDPQRRLMHRLFGQLGVSVRADRLDLTCAIIGRPIGSSEELTSAEATVLIDTLTKASETSDPRAVLDGLLRLQGMGTPITTDPEVLPFDETSDDANTEA